MYRLLVILSLLFSQAILASSGSGYDEVYDQDGQPRGHYADVLPLVKDLSPRERDRRMRAAEKVFRGDNSLYYLPRVISEEEFEASLRAGVDQRARAIRAFLVDHYSGRKSYLSAGIVTEPEIQRIKARYAEELWEGKLDPNRINFIYGPDILRNPEGEWRVVEDNLGYVGGFGDLPLAYDLMLKQLPKLKDRLALHDPMDFYRELTDAYRSRAMNHGGEAVVYMAPPYPDNEEHRVRDILRRFGIRTITPHSREKFVITNEGVFTEDKLYGAATRRKVGFVILMGEISDLDPSHPLTHRLHVLHWAETIRKSQAMASPAQRAQVTRLLNEHLADKGHESLQRLRRYIDQLYPEATFEREARATRSAHGLVQAFLNKQVDLSYTPGVDFVGDKEFYLYLPQLIQFYLKEEPILKNIRTERFITAKGQAREKLIRDVFSDISKFVVKRTSGRGGDSVWVGTKLTRAEAENLRQMVRKSPADYIVQDLMPLSQVDGHIVDTRILSDVHAEEVIVSNVAWGRGLPVNGSGKVNLSGDGKEFTVLTVKSCQKIFK